VTIRVAVADDHPIVLTGIEGLIQDSGDMEVVALCTNGEDVVDTVLRVNPDVLLLDIRMPKKNGFEILKELGEKKSTTRVVLITGDLTEDDAIDAIRLGVRGVLLKQMAPRLLLECVRKVHAGEQWVEKTSFQRALEKMVRREEATKKLAEQLTKRELELMRGIAQKLSNRELSERFFITQGTVKIHLNSIYRKLGINGRVALTHFARESGLA